jgi:hypothetical protein
MYTEMYYSQNKTEYEKGIMEENKETLELMSTSLEFYEKVYRLKELVESFKVNELNVLEEEWVKSGLPGEPTSNIFTIMTKN